MTSLKAQPWKARLSLVQWLCKHNLKRIVFFVFFAIAIASLYHSACMCVSICIIKAWPCKLLLQEISQNEESSSLPLSQENEWKAGGCFSGFPLWPLQWCICPLRYFTHNVGFFFPFLWGLGGRHWQVLQSSFVAQPKQASATLDKAAGYHTNLHALLPCWKAHRTCQHGSALPEAPK